MSKNLQIGPHEGVPDQFIETVNDRLRRITTAQGTGTSGPAKDGKKGSPGPAGPPGAPGAGSGPAPLPPLLDAADIVIAQRWDIRGNVYDLGYDDTITPSEGADTAKIALIRITRIGPTDAVTPLLATDPSLARLELAVLPGPFVDSVAVNYSSSAYPYDNSMGAVAYYLEFQTLNVDMVAATGDPLAVLVVTTPMLFTQVTSVSESARYNDDPIARGLKVDEDIVVRVTNNPGEGRCSKWLDRNDGNGPQWCGWEPLTGNGDLHVSILNQPPGLVATNWTVWCAPGPVESSDAIPATAVSLTFSQAGPAILGSTVVTAARFGAINYTPLGGGIYGFSWDHIPATVNRANADIWYLRITAQDCDSLGNPAPDDRGRERGSFDIPGKAADEGLFWTWVGTALDILPLANNAIWGPVRTDIYNHTKVRIYAVSRAVSADGTATKQACWTGTEPADCVNATDHLSADIIQDPTKGKVPPAPTIVTATAAVNFQRNGTTYDFYPSGSFTAPTDPFGSLSYVRAELLNPSGSVVEQLDIPGPFTPTTVYPFANMPTVAVPSASQTWHVRYTPYNSADVAGTGVSVAITVAPNTITGLSGAEGAQYTEPTSGGAKSHINITSAIGTTNAPGLSTSAAQTVSELFSPDSGTTWFFLGLIDLTASGSTQSWEIWRPTDSSRTCKVAMIIGAFNFPAGQFTTESPTGPISDASLPSGTFRSSTFPLAIVGAPLAGDVTNAQVLARTAAGGFLYNDIVLQYGSDGVVWWGLPDGISWLMPAFSVDPNLWGVQLTVQYVDASGNPATTDQDGIEKGIQDTSGPGTFTCLMVNFYRFPSTGSTAVKARFRLRAFSRSAGAAGWKSGTFSTLQNVAWGGADHKDVLFGAAPASGIVPPTAQVPVAFLQMVLSYSLSSPDGVRPFFSLTAVITFPTGSTDIAKIGGVEVVPPASLNLPSLIIPAANGTAWAALPVVAGSPTLTCTPGGGAQPLLDTTYQVTAYPLDLALKRGPALNRTIVVLAAITGVQPPLGVYVIDSVTLSENARGRDLLQNTIAQLAVTAHMHADYGGIGLSVYYSRDAVSLGDQGHTFYWVRTTQTVKGNVLAGAGFSVPVPPLSQFIQVAIAPGIIPGDPSQTITAANLPVGAVKSNVYQLNGLPVASAAPGANVISSASLGTVTHAIDPDGAQNWLLRNIQWQDASPVIDPYAKHSKLIAFVCDASGTRATSADGGDDQVVAYYGVDGTLHSTQQVKWWGYPTDTSKDRARFRIEVDNGGGLVTVQNCWTSGAAFSDAVFGTSTGRIPAHRIDPATIGAGLTISNLTDGSQDLMDNNNNPQTSLINDWNFEFSPAGQIPTTVSTGRFYMTNGAGPATIRTDGGFLGNNYLRINGPSTQAIYRFDMPSKTPLYFSISARGSGATTTLQLFYLWLDKNGSFVGGANSIGTFSPGNSAWVKDAISGVIDPATNTSGSISGVYLAIANAGGEGGFWDVDCIVARQVTQNTISGQTQTQDSIPIGASDAIAALRAYSGVDNSASAFAKSYFLIQAADALSKVRANVQNGQVQIECTIGTGSTFNQMVMVATGFIGSRNNVPFNGYEGSLAAAVSAGKQVRGGIIIL